MIAYLLDGTYELFRAHFGAPPATVEGQAVGAARGLLRSLALWLRTEQPTYVGIAFDHVIESFRNQLFAGYKTGAGIDPDLASQFTLAEDVASALGLCVWPMVEFEADDALATAAARWPADGIVRIATPDKDLAQCVRGDRIVLWDRKLSTALNDAGVIGKYGVAPTSIPDWLALVGDSADGIPGLQGWGAKTAATVLRTYIHLDQIPTDAPWAVRVRAEATLRQTLATQQEDARLYRQLATLRTDAPLDASPDALRWRGPRPDLAPLCQRLGVDVKSLKLT